MLTGGLRSTGGVDCSVEMAGFGQSCVVVRLDSRRSNHICCSNAKDPVDNSTK